jgi:hypothetical protein
MSHLDVIDEILLRMEDLAAGFDALPRRSVCFQLMLEPFMSAVIAKQVD